MKLLVVNGPNLNMLGIREPDVYGKTTYPVLVEMIKLWANELGIEVEVYQSNVCLHLRLNPDTVELVQGFTEDVRNKGHWGTGDLRIYLKSVDDFEKAKSLIDRAYNEN